MTNLKDSPFLDDLARMATGAVGALAGVREQIKAEVKSHVNQLLMQLDFVPREDFERVEAMAKNLGTRVAELEKAQEKVLKPKAAAKPAPAKKAVAKKPVAQKAAPKKAPVKKAAKK
jgi:BMFP domain-containing protein YqiC